MTRRTHVLVMCGMALAVAIQPTSGAAQASSEPPLIVGALEHHHIQWPDWGPSSFPELEKKYKFQARVLFKKDRKGWVTFAHQPRTEKLLEASTRLYPEKISWFVAFNGKTIGQFDTTAPKTIEQYADVGLHIPSPNSHLPMVGQRSREFSGWIDEPNLRPLVLVSRNHTADPQNWKPVQPPKMLLESGIRELRQKVGPLVFCNREHGETPTSNYPDAFIHHVKSYGSQDGQYLLALQLNASKNKCEEVPDAWAVSWFYGHGLSSLRFIGTGMKLLDAGDYDNDGASEVIFWRSGYNRDGYALYYDQFRQHVEFMWSYH